MGDAAKAFKSAVGKEVKLELDKESLPPKVGCDLLSRELASV